MLGLRSQLHLPNCESWFGDWITMRGTFGTLGEGPWPELAREKWVGKRVYRTGTDEYGTVLDAFWRGAGQPVVLSVDWDVQVLFRSSLTTSEHITIVEENSNG